MMKTQVFKSREECVEHYLKLKGKRIDFTVEEMKEFLTSTMGKETAEEKLPKDDLLLPTFVIIEGVYTWYMSPDIAIWLYFPEYAKLPYMWNAHTLDFKEQEDGTCIGEVPDKILELA